MPQIICSHHTADPCSDVIGDKALLSTAEAPCVCVCQEDVQSMYVCVDVFAVHVCVWCVRDGGHKQQHPTVLLPASLPICLCSVCLNGTDCTL